MNISGKTRIYKNESGLYSTDISNKKEDGTYEKMYVSVNFKKGVELENKTDINVTKGFLSFYKSKEGLAKIKLVILEFEEIKNEFSTITDDLPF